jgi:hypothetical protein
VRNNVSVQLLSVGGGRDSGGSIEVVPPNDFGKWLHGRSFRVWRGSIRVILRLTKARTKKAMMLKRRNVSDEWVEARHGSRYTCSEARHCASSEKRLDNGTDSRGIKLREIAFRVRASQEFDDADDDHTERARTTVV